jgi:ATP-binding cassette subfamily B protein
MSEYAEEEAGERAYDGRLMRRFLGYVWPYRGPVALAFLLMALRVGCELAGPLLFQRALDGPLPRHDYPGLVRYAILFAAVVVFTGAFEFLYSWTTNVIGQRIIYDLRLELFDHLQRLPIAFFDRNPVGRLVVRVTNDVESLNELFTSGLVEFAADLLLLVGVVVMMLLTHWKLALVTLAVTPLVLLLTLAFRGFARERYRDMRRKIARLNSNLNESVNGMRTIQTFGREKACLDRFKTYNAEYRDSAIGAIFAYSLFYPGIEVLSYLVLGLLVWYGGMSLLGGSLTFGTFMAIWYYAHKFFMPVREIAEKYNILQAAMAASERVFEVLDTPPETPGVSPAGPAVPRFRGSIAFEHVSFSYDGRTPVLEDLSFTVEPGRSLAVVGLTGAGKTTIINLLLRFYEPQAGVIRVDGRDLREFDRRTLRRQMGLVLQDVFLFAGSVEDNIRLGERELSRERILEAARAVNADRLIAKLPKGLETDVLERGAALSTGERQLLSFARALAFDPAILVLDEATSSVDAQTEQLIQEGLLRLMRGRTSIVIAHRLSTIQHSDRILVLHRGRSREEGTHAELLRQDGLYRKLFRLQQAGGPAGLPDEAGARDVGPRAAAEGAL